jgi:thermitase
MAKSPPPSVAELPKSSPHPAYGSPPVRKVATEPLRSHPVVRPVESEDSLSKLLRQRLNRPGAIRNEVLLKFRSPEDLRKFLSRADRSSIEVLGRLDSLSVARVGFDELDQLRALMEDDVSVYEGMDANFVVMLPGWPDPESRPPGSGTAPFRGEAFLHAIGADGSRSTWGEEVTVAVLDTGVEDHPTFGKGQITHLDLVNDGQPFDGHGTVVASLIGGQDEQASGVAPASHILDVRVANGQGESNSFTLADGIVQAADAGAQVINISLASYGDAAVVREAVAYAESMGAIVVAAAGNDQTANQLAYPAAIDSVVSVGGVDANLQQAYFANSGQGLDVTAPAVGIQSAYGPDSIVVGDGTSQATAITSGVVAYGLSRGSTTTSGAADWLKHNALPLTLSPERGGAGMTQVKSP